MKFIIRTSDRGTFKKCRRQWDMSSKVRMNYEPTIRSKYLEFGTAFHKAMEVYYSPDHWDRTRRDQRPVDGTQELAVLAFVNENRKQRKAHPFGEELETIQDYKEREELGRGMLDYYFSWAPDNDKFHPLLVEYEFEVPITNPTTDRYLYVIHHKNSQLYEPVEIVRNLEHDEKHDLPALKHDDSVWLKAVYQGRMDLVVKDFDGWVWIVDVKTASRLDDVTQWVDVDTQIGSYTWAATRLGWKPQGFVYQQHWKKFPSPPKELKNGSYSTDKSQGTSPTLYSDTITANGRIPTSKELDFLEWLKVNETTYVRRLDQPRSDREIALQGQYIWDEASDMINNPAIYPNPSKFNCQFCEFQGPCFIANEGGDYESVLESTAYRIRPATA